MHHLINLFITKLINKYWYNNLLFNWSPPKYKSLYNLWHLGEILSQFYGILYLENIVGLQLKRSTCTWNFIWLQVVTYYNKSVDKALHLPNQAGMMTVAVPPEEVLPAEVAFLLLVQPNESAVDSKLTKRQHFC